MNSHFQSSATACTSTVGWFDDSVVSGEERTAKPGREIYDVLVQRTGLNPATTVFIDDRPANTRAAEELGFISIKFRDAAGLREDLVRLGVLPGDRGEPDA